jgi:MFS family permease
MTVPAVVAVQMVLGSFYASYAFNHYMDDHVWGAPGANAASFMVCVGVYGAAAGFFGNWVGRNGVFRSVLRQLILTPLAWALAGIAGASGNYPLLLLGYGVCHGLGCAHAYLATTSCLTHWYPELKGFMSGLAVCGAGVGSYVWVLVARGLMNPAGDYKMDPPQVQYVFSVVFAIAIAASLPFLRNAPPGFKPAIAADVALRDWLRRALARLRASAAFASSGRVQLHDEDAREGAVPSVTPWTADPGVPQRPPESELDTTGGKAVVVVQPADLNSRSEASPVAADADLSGGGVTAGTTHAHSEAGSSTPAALRSEPHAALAGSSTGKRGAHPDREYSFVGAAKTQEFMLTACMMAGQVVTGATFLSSAADMTQNIFGFDASYATLVASNLNLVNFVGRFGWGFVTDKIGRKQFWLMSTAVQAAALVIMTAAIPARAFLVWLACFLLIGSLYGGGFGVIPAFLSDMFGPRISSGTHGFMILVWSATVVVAVPVFTAVTRAYSVHVTLPSGSVVAVPTPEAYTVNASWLAVVPALSFVATLLLNVRAEDRRLRRALGGGALMRLPRGYLLHCCGLRRRATVQVGSTAGCVQLLSPEALVDLYADADKADAQKSNENIHEDVVGSTAEACSSDASSASNLATAVQTRSWSVGGVQLSVPAESGGVEDTSVAHGPVACASDTGRATKSAGAAADASTAPLTPMQWAAF